MFSSFSFLRYGHQTADIKPFLKLTSARLFSQEPHKKLSLRRHKASLKIFEDKACKVPIKSSFFVVFIALVKTLFISTSSLSHGDFRSWRAGDMAAQNFKEEDWGNGDTKLGQNWHKNFQACFSKHNTYCGNNVERTQCSYCSKSYVRNNDLNRHVKQKAPRSRHSYICRPQCRTGRMSLLQ